MFNSYVSLPEGSPKVFFHAACTPAKCFHPHPRPVVDQLAASRLHWSKWVTAPVDIGNSGVNYCKLKHLKGRIGIFFMDMI